MTNACANLTDVQAILYASGWKHLFVSLQQFSQLVCVHEIILVMRYSPHSGAIHQTQYCQAFHQAVVGGVTQVHHTPETDR